MINQNKSMEATLVIKAESMNQKHLPSDVVVSAAVDAKTDFA